MEGLRDRVPVVPWLGSLFGKLLGKAKIQQKPSKHWEYLLVNGKMKSPRAVFFLFLSFLTHGKKLDGW